MKEFQHPNSIWTWKSSRRNSKSSLWLPYVSCAEKLKGGKWRFIYNGGEVDADLSQLDCIMFYGASGRIPVALIDELALNRIPLLVHRRNIGRPAVFLPAPNSDAKDILTRQIIARANRTKRSYVARTLVRARFRAVETTLRIPASAYRRLAQARSLAKIRAWEAEHARRYWSRFFSNAGHPGVLRREEGPLPAALNAGSMFLSGILLRWILLHRLSPSHGFLHQGTDYMGLVYDLMEPSRCVIEHALAEACAQTRSGETGDLTAKTLHFLKKSLEAVVYVPSTRQFVRRKNLLHGAVLALRAYLVGDMRRLVVPESGERRGGRPPKVSYRLPGDIPVR